MTMPFDRLDPDLQAFVAAMPKAEVHIHLEGAIQPETVLALAARHNMVNRLPSADLDELRRWFAFTDFPHFVRIYMTIQDMLRTPEDFALIVAACGADIWCGGSEGADGPSSPAPAGRGPARAMSARPTGGDGGRPRRGPAEDRGCIGQKRYTRANCARTLSPDSTPT